MASNKTFWSADGSVIHKLEPQAEKKLQILEDYLTDWVVTLCAKNPLMQKTLTIVDGFAGGGVYLASGTSRVPGSPVRIIKAILKGLEIVKKEKSKPNFNLDWKLICIEPHPEHFSCLKLALEEFDCQQYITSNHVELHNCEFEDKFEYSLEQVNERKGHSFFFIDPFGYTQYSIEQIRRIMEMPRTEILLNFMIDFMFRFANTSDGKIRKNININLEAGGYFTNVTLDDFEREDRQLYLRNESLRLIRAKIPADYVYIFSLLKTETIAKYYLIHLANNQTAQQVMKAALWNHSNASRIFGYQYGVTGLSYLPPSLENKEQLGLFDIYNGNQDRSLPDLFNQLMTAMEAMPSGITIKQLEAGTIQDNPADRNIYGKCIEDILSEGKFIKVRDHKQTKSRNLKMSDVLRRNPQQYFIFPGMRGDNPYK